MYDKEIKDLIYAYGGNKETMDDIIVALEEDIKVYLMNLLKVIHSKSPKMTCNAVLEALEGSVELYGAKRCLMLELAKKKYSKALKAEDADVDLDLVVSDDESDSDDKFEFDVFNMDDGSEAYKQYYKNLVYDLQQADILTLNMDSEEYLEYSNCAKSTFVFSKPTKFSEWLSINYKANRDALTILGWIAGYRLRRSVQKALDNRLEKENQSPLFGKPRYMLRDYSLQMEDFYPDATDSFFLKIDSQYRNQRKHSRILEKRVETLGHSIIR